MTGMTVAAMGMMTVAAGGTGRAAARRLGSRAVLTRGHAVPPDSSPTLLVRVLAFSAIIVAGACGGMIGFAVIDLTCDDGCSVAAGLVGLASAVGAAAGVGVVAVLTLRAAAEWRAQQPPADGHARAGSGRVWKHRGS